MEPELTWRFLVDPFKQLKGYIWLPALWDRAQMMRVANRQIASLIAGRVDLPDAV